MDIAFQIISLVFLLLLSAFFSSAEAAFLSVSRIQLQHLRDNKKTGAESLAKLKAKPTRTIITILVGNNVVNIAASVLAANIALKMFGDAGLGIATGAMTFLILVFGEITPKTIATTHSVLFARRLAPVLLVLQAVMLPAIWFFEAIIRFVPGASSKSMVRMTEDEIKAAVRLGADDKSISEQEKNMIENVLMFNDKTVAHCMTPSEKVVGLKPEMSVEVAFHKAVESKHSRFPVLSGKKAVGVMSVKRLAYYAARDPHGSVAKYMFSPPNTFSIDTPASKAFAYMQSRAANIALVTDKHGSFVGVVTLKDLLGELVGKIA